MGLSFDGNGRYIGWSNLFDYSDIRSLNASEYLPVPRKRKYIQAVIEENKDDINSYIYNILQSEENIKNIEENIKSLLENLKKDIEDSKELAKKIATDLANQLLLELLELKIENTRRAIKLSEENLSKERAARMRLYVILIKHLNTLEVDDNNTAKVFYSIEGAEEVMRNVAKHEFTKIPYSLQEDSNKNFISSHIQNTVLNLRNMIGAYSPIDMDIFRDASKESPKGEQASKMTLLNPATKLLMQYLNITGKNVIGIAANGEKASFMWHYYINSVLRNPTEETLNQARFSFKTSRILGRSTAEGPREQEINTLPDVNFEGVDPEIVKSMGGQLHGLITVDLMISQILSAATDNAKELILAKVNAGNKLAKMYLFLVTLGFDVKDIVKFMTSPAASFIDSITEENIFTGLDLDIPTAIKLARGDYKDLYKKYLSSNTIDKIGNEMMKKIAEGKFNEVENKLTAGSFSYIELENFLNDMREIEYLRNYEINEDILADIDEFENVLEGADEFSNMGRLLGANQGLPTSKSDLLKQVQFILSILSNRIKAANRERKAKGLELIEEGDPLDVNRYFKDENYKKEIISKYEEVKKCSNIFAIIDMIDQYKSIFKIFSAVLDIDHNIAIKTRTYDAVYDEIKKEGFYLSELYLKNLLKGIDDLLISTYVYKSGIRIPYPADIEMLNDLRLRYTISNNGLLEFNSLGSVASFKYLFENSIIPLLKDGYYYNTVGDKIERISDESIKANAFIQSLIRGYDKKIPLYKCDLNMLTVDNTRENQLKFLKYIKGLQELQRIKINGTSLSDLFVLYNLIVNKDLYGSDRLTTLFDSFILNNGQLSLIRDYFVYVGEYDYPGNGHSLEYNIRDLMVRAAPIVNSEIGLKDPTIIVNTEDGPVLKIRNGSTYADWSNLIPMIEGETLDEYLERIYNHNSYFVLGGSYKDLADLLVQDIMELNSDALNTINLLFRDGVLKIYKVCQ